MIVPQLIQTPALSATAWLEEAQAAQAVMARLLSPSVSRHAGLEVSVRFEAAGFLSGDFCDPFPLTPDQMVCCIGDVAGKGIPAALIVATLQATLRAHFATESSPRRVLRAANQQLLRCIAPHRFVTLFLGYHRRDSGVLRYVNCGHPPALLVRRCGKIEEIRTGHFYFA